MQQMYSLMAIFECFSGLMVCAELIFSLTFCIGQLDFCSFMCLFSY